MWQDSGVALIFQVRSACFENQLLKYWILPGLEHQSLIAVGNAYYLNLMAEVEVVVVVISGVEMLILLLLQVVVTIALTALEV